MTASGYVIVSGILNIPPVLYFIKALIILPSLRFLSFVIPLLPLHFPFFFLVTCPLGIVPSAAEYQHLETTYGLSSLDGVESG